MLPRNQNGGQHHSDGKYIMIRSNMNLRVVYTKEIFHGGCRDPNLSRLNSRRQMWAILWSLESNETEVPSTLLELEDPARTRSREPWHALFIIDGDRNRQEYHLAGGGEITCGRDAESKTWKDKANVYWLKEMCYPGMICHRTSGYSISIGSPRLCLKRRPENLQHLTKF